MKIEHLSVSQINDYTFCGERWRLKKQEGLFEPKSPQAFRGTAVHRSVAKNMRSKRDTGEMISRDEAGQIAFDSVNASFDTSPVVLTGADATEGIAAVRGREADLAVGMARLHHRKIAPGIDPVDVEKKVTVTVKGFDLPPLVGVLDITDKLTYIHDTKTSSRKPHPLAADLSTQLSAYELQYRAEHGRPPAGLILDHLIYRQPTATRPKGDIVEEIQRVSHRRAEALQGFLDRMVAVHKAMSAGIAIPADVNDWRCQNCGFWGDACRYTRGLIRPAGG